MPFRQLTDVAQLAQNTRLTNTEENMTLLKHALVTGGVETTGICRLSAVNMNARIVCINSALRVGSINIDWSVIKFKASNQTVVS